MKNQPTNRSGISRVEASFRAPRTPDRVAAAEREPGRDAFASAREEPLLDQLAEVVRITLRVSAAVLSGAREGREHFRAAAGLPAPLAERKAVPLSESIARVTHADGTAHAIGSGLGQRNALAQAFGWTSSLSAPVPGRTRPIGALWVVSETDREWTPADREQIAAFACLAAEIAAHCEVRDRAESESRDRLARFTALAGSVPHGLWCAAFDEPIPTSLTGADQVDRILERGRLIECNDVLARILGAAFAEDLLDLPLRELIDENDDEVRAELLEMVRDNYRLDALSTPVPRGKSGERRQLANLAGVVEHGRLIRLWGVVRSEPQRAAAPVRPGRSIEAIARLAGGVAHEFNNLLTTIRGHTELALRDRQDDDDLAEIRRATDRASALTRQLLAFSRKPIARPRVVDAAALVADLENVLHHLVGDGQLAIRRTAGTGLLRADLAQLERALIQLVSFVRDADPSEAALLIDISDADMETGSGATAAAVGIRVSHPTLVLDRETLENIATSAFGDLTLHGGEGLVAAFALVRQNGGDIVVQGHAGAGTSFLILFPRLADTGTITEPPDAEDAVAAAETVLVVEDEDAVRAVARRTLLLQGYTVMEAENAQVALDLAKGYGGRIDLLLTDVVMPGVDGPELSRQLRSDRPETKVLFMSGYSGDAVPAGVLARDGFLEKPFTPMALARAVRQTLDRPDA